MRNLLILILVLSFSCGRASMRPAAVMDPREAELAEKAKLYAELTESFRDGSGFIDTEHCDSLLFSGLLGAALPGTVDILAARDDTKAWHRRPAHDCSPSIGNSRSTISRDMVLGLFWHIWKNKQLVVAQELMDDLRRNAYKLRGQGTLGELLMNPSMMSTLAHIILKLGGPRYPVELALPVVFGKSTGFIAHLTVWHILLRAELLKEIDSDELDILRYHAQRNPQNPLYSAAYHKWLDGDMGNSVELLLTPSEWPSERLPSTAEHCAPWVIQRDFTEKDWGPCLPQETHTGAPLIIIYNLIIKN